MCQGGLVLEAAGLLLKCSKSSWPCANKLAAEEPYLCFISNAYRTIEKHPGSVRHIGYTIAYSYTGGTSSGQGPEVNCGHDVGVRVLRRCASGSTSGSAGSKTDPATCVQCHEDKTKGKAVHSAIAMGCTACHRD